MTLDDLAALMEKGFAKAEKSTDKKIEDLAGMVNRNFDRMDERFANMDKRFEKVDERFDKVEAGIKKLSKDVTDISYKVTQIDKRLFSLEEDIYVTKKKQQEKLEKRVVFIESRLGIESAS